LRASTVRRSAPAGLALLALGALAVAVPATSATASQPAAPKAVAAATTATNGKIAYTCTDHGTSTVDGWVVASSTGAGKTFRPWQYGNFRDTAQWSADGTELVHAASYVDPGTLKPQHMAVIMSEPDGSYPWRATNFDQSQNIADYRPSWAPNGRYLSFTRNSGTLSVHVVNAAGSDTPPTVGPTASDYSDVSVNNDIVYSLSGEIWLLPASSDTPVLIGHGSRPKFSPDGTLVSFLGPLGLSTMNLDGTNPQAAAGPTPANILDYDWSPDATKWIITTGTDVYIQDIGTGAHNTLVGGYECRLANEVSWQPVPTTPAQVVRMAGADRVGTSIAVSHASFADGTADAVVLADSLHFPDALAGTPLAVKEHAPMLLTNGSQPTPDARVLTEIARVLKPTAKQVFLLGGTASLSQGIEDTLTGAGYTITRFAGATRYDTALKIAQFMGTGASAPQEIMLATGTDFPDGLSAGAAAASYWDGSVNPDGGVVLLTQGTHLTPAVQAYISSAIAGHTDPDHQVYVSTVGGLADQAYHGANKISLVGADRYATSELVAEVHFGPQPDVAIATGVSFPDALSGGAYAGALNAPLLLAPPSLATETDVPYYLHAQSAAIDRGLIFGGTGVVSSTVETQLGQIIGVTVTHTTVTGSGGAHVLAALSAADARQPVHKGAPQPLVSHRG
jgi:putative cell wall-binding protein